MKVIIKNCFGAIKRLLSSILFAKKTVQDDSLLKILEQARLEWNYSKLYFNSVIEPDLIDHAIYYMGATEKKYTYLLKHARAIGLNAKKYNFKEY